MVILAVIAARKGSKRVKNKNLRLLAGKPLIVHSLEQVRRWGGSDRFIVSTDSNQIAAVARKHGADVPFLRPKAFSGDKIGKVAVLRHALEAAEKFYQMKFDAVLDVDATAPIRRSEDIDGIVRLFKKRKADCVFSAVRTHHNPYFNMVEINSKGLAVLCKKSSRLILRGQDAPVVYQMNASLYVYARDFLLDPKSKLPYSGRSCIYEMSPASAVDIDTETDFQYVDFLIRRKDVKL